MIIDDKLINKLSEETKNNHRLFNILNICKLLPEKAHRLLYVIEPEADFEIRKHMDTEVTLIVLKGMLKVSIYDEHGSITDECMLNPLNGQYGYHIDKNVWYNYKAMAPSTIVFSVDELEEAPFIYKNRWA